MKSLFILIIFAFPFLTSAQSNSKYKGFLEEKASIAGKSGGVITKAELLTAKELVLHDSIKDKYKIFQFKMTIVPIAGEMVELESNNGKFSDKMVAAIKDAKPKGKIMIEYIKCNDSKSDIYSVYPLEFEIE